MLEGKTSLTDPLEESTSNRATGKTHFNKEFQELSARLHSDTRIMQAQTKLSLRLLLPVTNAIA